MPSGAIAAVRTASSSRFRKPCSSLGESRELGGALLAAYEKGDAEALASIRAVYERDLLTPGIRVR
jgi:hypothetical protein